MIRPPPPIRNLILTGQVEIPLRARQVVVLHVVSVLLVHRHGHPPSAGFPAVVENQLVQRAGDGDVELTVVFLVFELTVVLPIQEPFDEIPENMRDELRSLVVEIEGRVVLINPEG